MLTCLISLTNPVVHVILTPLFPLLLFPKNGGKTYYPDIRISSKQVSREQHWCTSVYSIYILPKYMLNKIGVYKLLVITGYTFGNYYF